MVFVYTYSKTGGSAKSKADATWLLHSSNKTIAAFYVINLILLKVVASTIYLSPYLCVLQVDFVFQ